MSHSSQQKLGQAKADLERHFDLIKVKHHVATPKLVLESYKTPLNVERIGHERIENLNLGEKIETCVNNLILYNNNLKMLTRTAAFLPQPNAI